MNSNAPKAKYRRWYDKQAMMLRFLSALFQFQPAFRNYVGKALAEVSVNKYEMFIEKEGPSLPDDGIQNYYKAYNKRRRYDKITGMHRTMLTHALLPEPKQHELSGECCRLSELVEDYIQSCNHYGFSENPEHVESLSKTYAKQGAEASRRLLLALKKNLKQVAADQLVSGTRLSTKA